MAHENDKDIETKASDMELLNNMPDIIKTEELGKPLQVPSSILRSIKISKIEERNEQHRLSKSKYTVYTITCSPPIVEGVDIFVCRRYNDFKWLRKVFIECYPSIFIPPIPPPQLIGRFNKKFTLQRKKDLERFLNRICAIKPLSESLTFIMFLSRPEQTFDISKDEIRRNHIPTIKQKIQFLNKLFPSFAVSSKLIKQYNNTIEMDLYNNEYLSNEEIIKYKQESDNIIFGNEIKQTNEFLKKICSKMSGLCDIVKKLNGKLYKLSIHTKRFHEAYWQLHSKNNEYKFKELTIFGDDKRDFYGWYNYNKSIFDINNNILYINLLYQYHDINAFMDIFNNRNKYLAQFTTVLSRNKNWQNLIDLKYDLQPHQVTQIQMDFKKEKSLRCFLLISTKIIINYNINKIWKQIINDWKNMVVKYAQSQLLTHQILFAESYQENENSTKNGTDNSSGNSDDEKSVSEILDDSHQYYEYEPVFDAEDSRQYSHNHAERTLIEEKQNIDIQTTVNESNVVNKTQ